MPRQLAWCKRSVETGKMIVQLDPWALLRRKSHVVWHFSIKEAIPSFDPRRACATSFDAYKQVGSTPTSGAMKDDRLARGAKARGLMKISLLFVTGEDAPRWGT